ncbi:MAG: VCBS repeat-containing protein [Verrucomicrobiales bacterium]
MADIAHRRPPSRDRDRRHRSRRRRRAGFDRLPQVTENLTAWLNRLRERGPWKPERITANVQNVADIEGADLDGDGDPDLATAGNGGAIYWLNLLPPQEARCPAAGIASARPARRTSHLPISTATAISTRWSPAKNGIVWRRTCRGSRGKPRTSPRARRRAGASMRSLASFCGGQCDQADIDGDGDPDVPAAAPEEGDLACSANPRRAGASWEQVAITDTAKGASQLAAADFDQDGDLDFAASFTEDDAPDLGESRHHRRQGGARRLGRSLVDAQAHGLKTLHAADFDGRASGSRHAVIDPQSGPMAGSSGGTTRC